MSVDHLWSLTPEPAIEAYPSARIGETFAHPQGQKCHPGRGQFDWNIATIA
jgi:hypothetical protein